MYAIRVEMALGIKGLSYDYLPEDPWSKSGLLLVSNPMHNKLPILFNAGRPVCESLIIVQFLNDAFPRNDASTLPSDPYNRALARFWAAYGNNKLFPSCIGILMTAKQQAKVAKVEETMLALRLLEAAMVECTRAATWDQRTRAAMVVDEESRKSEESNL